MHLKIKLPNSNIEIELENNASVEDLRAMCANKLNTSPADLCLVFKGKIMRDKDALSAIDVVDGCSVHCAYKKVSAAPPSQTNAAPVQKSVSSQTQAASNSTLGSPLAPMNLQNHTNLVQSLSENPELLRLFTDPTFVENMASMDPRLKSLFETFPELASALRDPQVLRQILELVKNPQALQEAMRNQDRLLTQLQNVPGGMNQYIRIFNDLNRISQNPLGGTGTQSSSTAQSAVTQSDSTTANVSGEAMPNPWVSASGGSFQQAASSSTTTPKKQGVVENSALFRDVANALKLSNSPDNNISMPFLERIHQGVLTLSPRGQYGLTEFVKGLEILKEESPELIANMLNYQLSTLRLNILGNQDSNTSVDTTDEFVPPELGNEFTYQTQLEELYSMGFSNKQENLEALKKSYGDVNRAVEWILGNRGIQ